MSNFTPAGVELLARGHGSFMADMGSANNSILRFGKAAVINAAKATAAFGMLAIGIGVVGVRAAVSFESAWAGVVKTTDGLVDEFGNLTQAGTELQQGFRDLSMEAPIAVEALMEIGELGGQLGVAKDDLTTFTETIAAMGVSTNLTTEQAATGFAQMANVMGTTTRMGGEAFERLGSTIVALGNSSATTERDILNFAQRIAGAGAIAGLTESDVLGISAAFSSVGVSAEAGGTAVQKVLLGINTAVATSSGDMGVFAAIAGMSADEFGQAWEEDAGRVFQEFVSGLGAAGDDAILILDELGLKDQRLIKAFLSLAQSGDVLTDSLDLANVAWDENSALAAEAAQRYATTESQFQLFKNTLNDVAITIGMYLLPMFNKLLTAGMSLFRGIGEVVKAVVANFGALGNLPWEDILPPGLARIAYVIAFAFDNLVYNIRALVSYFRIAIGEGDILNDYLMHLPEAVRPFIKAIAKLAIVVPKALRKIIKIVKDNKDAFVGAFKAIATVMAKGAIISTILKIGSALLGLASPLNIVMAAVGLLGAAWGGNWFGIREKTAEVIEFLRPIITEFIAWLQDLIPQALQIAADFFNGVLVPAIQIAADFWMNTLLPAFQTAWTFINDYVIPAFQQIVNWLGENVPTALATLQEVFNTVWPVIRDTVVAVVTELVTFALELFGQLVSWVQENWPLIKDTVETVLNTVRDIVKAILSGIVTFWEEHGQSIMSFVSLLWENIKSIISAALDIILGGIQLIMGIIQGDWEVVWNAILTIVTSIWGGIKSIINVMLGLIKIVIETVLGVIKRTMESIWNSILAIIKTVWEGVKRAVMIAVNVIKDTIETVMTSIFNIISTIWGIIEGVFSTVWETIQGIVSGGIEGVLGILEGVLGRFYEIGKAIIQNLWNGIKNLWQELWDWFNDRLQDLADLWPFSEPKDPKSPLRGLSKAGEAIVKNVMEGLQRTMPELQTLLQAVITPATSIPVVAAPVPANGRGSTTYNEVNLNMQSTISNGMDLVTFEQRVLQAVTAAIQQG